MHTIAMAALIFAACYSTATPPADMAELDLARAELAPGPDLAPHLGEPCERNEDCAPAFICGAAYGFGAPWDYCTLFCGLSTPAMTGCPAGWNCLRVVDARNDGGDASSYACIRN
jgi:hypothetical protein